jgi:hypothetical protein
MKKNKNTIRIYNGAAFCPSCSSCPVVEYSPDKKVVIISDPAKPKSGRFTMSVEEYNTLVKNAKPIE